MHTILNIFLRSQCNKIMQKLYECIIMIPSSTYAVNGLSPIYILTSKSIKENFVIYSLAHDKGSFVLLLMSSLHFPHHFQKRKCLWIAISGPLLEVKCSNFQTSRRALRGVSPHISLVERYWSTRKQVKYELSVLCMTQMYYLHRYVYNALLRL